MMNNISQFFKSKKETKEKQSPEAPDRSPNPNYQKQSYSKRSSQPQIYVLPYPPPPYYNTAYYSYPTEPIQKQENSNRPSQCTEEHIFQSSPVSPSQQSQPESSNQQNSSQQRHQPIYGYYPGQPPTENIQRSNQQNSSQPDSPKQQKSSQEHQLTNGYYIAQPPPENIQRPNQQNFSQTESSNQQKSTQQRHQPTYGYYPGQPPPENFQYVSRYPFQPPSAEDTTMVRPGERLRQIDEPEEWTGFDDKKVRASFIRKVYSILMLQLLFTLGVIALFVFEPNVKRFVQENIYLYYISLVIFIAVYLAMACIQSVRRKFPTNIIVLCIFTLAMSYMLGTISSVHNTDAVFMAVGVCAAVCFAVSVFSFYTKFDFTSIGGILCILLLILFGFGLIAIFIPSKVMTMIYAATGAIVFSLFLAYDTQMMMGGKNYELSPEEYIFAAVQIYIDIVYIFIFLLMLFGENN